jgi:pimeloyl-ACP methyl ester carboxylesterase
MEEFLVPARDAGVQIYVRNKRRAGQTQFTSERTLLFVHGATYPGHVMFDLSLDGLSWMDFVAQRGYDVYLLDLRGYGHSTRPPEMSQPPDANPPIVTGAVAIQDIQSVVEHILQRRSITKLNLLGHSWGTALTAAFATQNAETVNRLVLYAPVWLVQNPSTIPPSGQLGAYRAVTREQSKERMLRGVQPDKQAELLPARWFDAWADAAFASDPEGAQQNPPVVRAPNGVVQDGQDYWVNGKAYFDPAQIKVPVLLVHGEWDQDTPPYMAQNLFGLLTNAPYKRYIVIGEATHGIQLEKNRLDLFNAVQQFLEE